MSASQAAPVAPGRLGEAIDARALLEYLTALGRWVDERRRELDRLDAAALASTQSDSYTADIVLGESLWQSTKVRREELEREWDSGRADTVARERMSTLIWGRRAVSGGGAGAGAGGVGAASGVGSVSLVEAVRLLDALVGQLRTRLSFDPDSAGVSVRIAGVRAGLERCRDLTVQVPRLAGEPSIERVDTLRRRLDGLGEKAARGADVTGPLGQLEQDSARLERDLIVASATRVELGRDVDQARRLRASLVAREPSLRALAERCRREILAPPRFAVPDVSRLGDVPADRDELTAYSARLDAVSRAFEAIEDAYSAPLRERAELRFRLAGDEAKARSNGRLDPSTIGSAAVRSGLQDARAAVESAPCDLALTRLFVEQFSVLVRPLPASTLVAGAAGAHGPAAVAATPPVAPPAAASSAAVASAAASSSSARAPHHSSTPPPSSTPSTNHPHSDAAYGRRREG